MEKSCFDGLVSVKEEFLFSAMYAPTGVQYSTVRYVGIWLYIARLASWLNF